MARAERVILTNMCMVTDGQGNVLVQNRNDPGWPGIVYPGGHVEPGESITDSVIREVREETGLTVIEPRLCGIKHFHTEENIRYIVFLYKADRWTGELRSSEEGEALWIPRSELLNCKTAGRFGDMLPMFEDDSLSELFYREGEAIFL